MDSPMPSLIESDPCKGWALRYPKSVQGPWWEYPSSQGKLPTSFLLGCVLFILRLTSSDNIR